MQIGGSGIGWAREAAATALKQPGPVAVGMGVEGGGGGGGVLVE